MFSADSTDFAPNNLDNDTFRERRGSAAVDVVSYEGFEAKSDMHGERKTNFVNASSERSDLDSVGQEMARSMITVFLPQAIPLLKEASRSKQTNVVSLELNCHAETNKKNSITRGSLDIQKPGINGLFYFLILYCCYFWFLG